MQRLELRLLGELRVSADGVALAPPASRRARAVLGWLALHPGLHPRGELAARMWPDVLDRSARGSLRSALWSLRGALGPAAERLVATADVVGLADDGVWVDALAFRELVAAGRTEEALALAGGELLADLDDDWVLEARGEQRGREAAALGRLAAAAEAGGELPRAVEHSRRRVELEPLDEDGWRDLIRRLIAAGDRAGALAAYRSLRLRLRRELRIAPAAETRALVEALREPVAPGPAPRVASAGPALVGRDGELDELLGIADAALGGSGAAVAIAGEPGIGKTRLASEVAGAVEARVARCAAVALQAPAPLAAWADLLDDLLRGLTPPAGAAWAEELAAVVPRLGREPPQPALPPGLRRARLFEAVVELVEWAAAGGPVVLVLEDLHAADRSSLELAEYVGRRIAGLPVLMVLTHRDSPRRPELDLLLEALRSRAVLARELTLARLAAPDVRRLAHLAAELADVEDIVEVAAGSPLIAVETARAHARGEREVAGSLRRLTRAWMAGLDEGTRALAELVAVAGRDLDAAELTALGAEAPAVDAGLLVAADGRVGYRHALLRDAAYAELPARRRAALHEALADALERRGERHAGEVVTHLRSAGRGDRAIAALRVASRRARAVGSLDDAARLLGEALELAGGDAGLWLELAEVEAWRQRREDVDAAFARALERIAPGDGPALVDAWLRRAGWYQSTLCTPRETREAAARARETLDALGLALPAAEARALAAAAWAEAVAGDPDEADRLLARLGEPEAGGDLLRCEADNARGLALIRRGRLEESCAALVRAAQAAHRAGRPDLAYGCWDEAASAAACAGRLDEALALLDRGTTAIDRRGLIGLEARLWCARSQVLVRLDRLADARAAARRARELAERLGDGRLLGEADHQEGMVALAAGEPAHAERLLAAALAADPPISRPLARLARAEALVGLARLEAAEAELRAAALEPVGPGDFPDTLVARMERLQGLVAAARGDHGLARRRLERAAAGWRRRLEGEDAGRRYAAVLADLGRPAVAVVEPERELARVVRELERVGP